MGGVLVFLLLSLFVLSYAVDLFDQPDVLVSTILRRTIFLVPFLLLAIEEAGVPLPVPGDVAIAYIGYRAHVGAISYPIAFLALLAAVLVGSSCLFYLSSRWGALLVRKLGRFMHLSDDKLASAERRFRQHGPWFIIIGRHIPGLRIPITVFCGVSAVPYRIFIGSTFVSVIFWIAFWLIVGSKLGGKTVHLLHGSHWYTMLIPIGVVIAVVLVSRGIARVRGRVPARAERV